MEGRVGYMKGRHLPAISPIQPSAAADSPIWRTVHHRYDAVIEVEGEGVVRAVVNPITSSSHNLLYRVKLASCELCWESGAVTVTVYR